MEYVCHFRNRVITDTLISTFDKKDVNILLYQIDIIKITEKQKKKKDSRPSIRDPAADAYSGPRKIGRTKWSGWSPDGIKSRLDAGIVDCYRRLFICQLKMYLACLAGFTMEMFG